MFQGHAMENPFVPCGLRLWPLPFPKGPRAACQGALLTWMRRVLLQGCRAAAFAAAVPEEWSLLAVSGAVCVQLQVLKERAAAVGADLSFSGLFFCFFSEPSLAAVGTALKLSLQPACGTGQVARGTLAELCAEGCTSGQARGAQLLRSCVDWTRLWMLALECLQGGNVWASRAVMSQRVEGWGCATAGLAPRAVPAAAGDTKAEGRGENCRRGGAGREPVGSWREGLGLQRQPPMAAWASVAAVCKGCRGCGSQGATSIAWGACSVAEVAGGKKLLLLCSAEHAWPSPSHCLGCSACWPWARSQRCPCTGPREEWQPPGSCEICLLGFG